MKPTVVPFNIKIKLVSYNIKVQRNIRLNNRNHEILSVIFIIF